MHKLYAHAVFMFSAGGGCGHAIAARCCAAWGGFGKLLPVLASEHISFGTRGKVFIACVRSAMLRGSETWAPGASDLLRLRRDDRAMIRWICGAKLEDEISSAVLHQRLDVDEITAVLRTRRLGWCGRVRRAASCVGSIARLGVPGAGGRGRPGVTWSACVRDGMTVCGLDGVGPLDGNSWGAGVRRCQVLPTPESGTTAAP